MESRGTRAGGRFIRLTGAHPGAGIEHFLRLEADQATCSCKKEYNSGYPLTSNGEFVTQRGEDPLLADCAFAARML